ncbi:MAG TPA: Hachiman antiphage defense system protein HamA [Mucilaginibacter sp.]|jgi:hypothetical protein
MPWTSEHISWLKELSSLLTTSDGRPVNVFEFTPDIHNSTKMSVWAKHFRNHYALDTEIDELREGTGLSRKDYLLNLKFPSLKTPGPSIRAGDFAEILVADYLEYALNHWVPRTRYSNKTIRDESTKGSDLIGFKLFDSSASAKDMLTVLEVKAQFSGKTPDDKLQDAIEHSAKDKLRLAESLNAIKQRLRAIGQTVEARSINRFQDPVDKPYQQQFGAAALFTETAYDDTVITTANTINHPDGKNLFLIVIRADSFMDLVHHLYDLAANEA